MTLKPLFVITMALALRDAYTIDLALVAALILFPVRWRNGFDDLLLLLLSSVTFWLLIRYMDWHRWYPFAKLALMERGGEIIRTQIHASILAATTGVHQSFTQAILLGDTSHLPSNFRPLFQSLGMSHMLAVSGFHVGFWVLLFSPLNRLCRSIAVQGLPFVITASFLVLYTSTVGSSASVLRAVWSFVLARIAILSRQKLPPLHIPMAVAIVHFLWNPEAPASLSFQLSYTAVFAILIALRGTGYDRMMLSFTMEAPSRKTNAGKRLSKVLVPLHISLAAWSATLPIVQFHFGGSSPYFLIGNLLFVPLFTLIVWLTAAQLLLHPWLPESIAETTDILVRQMLTYMQKVLWILGEGEWLGL